jgi:diacylglycerol O-acyltransferase
MSTTHHALERLSPLDVSNLRVERHGLPMNVAALAILEGAPLLDASGELALEAIRARIEQCLHRAPRLRQELYAPGFGFGPPVWVDDASFDISRHVRTRTVPVRCDEEALLTMCAELNEQPFDRARPLWEIWFLTGQLDRDVAMLIRFHHVLADGMAALALLGALFDAAPETAAEREAPAWTSRPAPIRWNLLIDNLRRHIAAVRVGLGQIEHPRAAPGRGRTLVRQVAQIVREGRGPRVSFNRPAGKHHRLMLVRADLDRAKTVAHAHGATVNDVVLSAMAGGAHAMLAARGEHRRDLVLKVSVSASVRALTSEKQTGNLVGIMVVPVPVGEPDPFRRLEQIARATAERKRLPPYQPAGRLMQRWMVHVMNRQRLVNLLASNLAGPSAPMYFAGAKILEVFQIGVVQGNLALTVGVLSYAGQLNFDIVGDIDAVPGLAVFAKGVTDELERLGARFPAHKQSQDREAYRADRNR